MNEKIYEIDGERVHLYRSTYREGGRIALYLVCVDGAPCTTLTVNVPEAPLGENELLIKNWAEAKGQVAWLQEQGLAEPTGRTVASGYVDIPVMRLLVPLESINEGA